MIPTLPPSAPEEVAVWMPSGAATDRPYRSTRRLGLVLVVLLAGAVVVGTVSIAVAVADYRFVDGLLDHPTAVDTAAIATRNDRASVVTSAALLTGVVTAGFFIAWTYRMYANLGALGVRGRRFGNGWAVGGWFVPILNLVRPKQIVDDIWRSSDPLGHPGERWQERSVPTFLHAWWGVLLLSVLVGRTVDTETADPSTAVRNMATTVLVDLLGTGAAVLALVVVIRLSKRQALRAQALGLLAGSPGFGRPVLWLLRGTVALVGTAVVVALAAVVSATSGAGDGHRTKFVTDLDTGDCWLDPADLSSQTTTEFLAVQLVPCSEPHDNEVYAVVRHPRAAQNDPPSDSELMYGALEACEREFEPSVGVPPLRSGLDVVAIWPDPSGWELGSRMVVCSAYRLDGRPLDETVRGAGT
jgi:hypothetical protein